MRVLTVIVSWNTRDLLRRCLDTLLQHTSVDLSVVVVDNASSDGSSEMVRREFSPAVQLLEPGENLGFAAANNLAIRTALQNSQTQGVAPFDQVLLLNPDTEVSPGAVDSLSAFLRAHPAYGAVGAHLLNSDGSPQRSFDHFWFRRPFASFVRNHLPARKERGIVAHSRHERLECDWVIGACLMLRLSALSRTGLLDEAFRIYGEEVDLQYRLRQWGYRVALLPWVKVLHHGGQSAKQAPLSSRLLEHRARYLLVHKHCGFPIRTLYIGKALAELSVEALRGPNRQDALELVKAHLRPSFYEYRGDAVPFRGLFEAPHL